MKEEIRRTLREAGAVAVGFARAGEVDPELDISFQEWIKGDNHGEMDYLRRHIPLRRNTDSVLSDARTVISLAFSYFPHRFRNDELAYISTYAYVEDYHFRLREILKPVVKKFEKAYGGRWRICIDSAPVAERYWAIKSGIGIIGLNGSVIVDGCGSFGFLVEILTTLELDPDKSNYEKCGGCGKCVEICPSQALKGDGTMDARRCINYLTIEKKGEFSEEEKKITGGGVGYLFGCDRCLRVCPFNNRNDKKGNVFQSGSNKTGDLTPEKIIGMTPEEFVEKYGKTPLGYAGYEKLLRNASNLK